MRTLVLCACVLTLASFSLAVEPVEEAVKSVIPTFDEEAVVCVDESHITNEEWYKEEQIITEVYKEPGQEERVKKNGCTMACILKRLGFMEESDLNEAKIHAYFNKELEGQPEDKVTNVNKVVHDCIEEVKDITGECEKGFSTMVCVTKKVNKILKHHTDHEEHNEETENN